MPPEEHISWFSPYPSPIPKSEDPRLTSTASTGRNSSGQASLLREIRPNHGDGGGKQAARADPDTQPLGEKHLIELGADRGHHHAEHLQEDAESCHVVKIAGIEGAAAEDAHEKQQKCLDGPNPRYRGRCRGCEQDGGVVCLEHPKCIAQTPR